MSFHPRATYTSPAGGEPVFLVGDTYTVLLTAQQSDGRLGLVEALVPAQAGPPPHRHHREAETFLVVDGQLLVTTGDPGQDDYQEYAVSPGGVVHVPLGMRHSFRNTSHSGPAKMIVIFTPAGLEAMFTDIGTPGTRGQLAAPLNDSDVQAMAAVADEYGYSFDL